MIEPGGILGLDLSGMTGFAYGKPGSLAKCGVWTLPRYALDPGRCLAALSNELADAIWKWQPVEIWVEAPLTIAAQTHPLSAMQQYQLDGVVKEIGYRWERPVKPAHATTVRKDVLGRSNNVSKDDVVTWARSQGWDITDHNAADAAMVWFHGCKSQKRALIAA